MVINTIILTSTIACVVTEHVFTTLLPATITVTNTVTVAIAVAVAAAIATTDTTEDDKVLLSCRTGIGAGAGAGAHKRLEASTAASDAIGQVSRSVTLPQTCYFVHTAMRCYI